MILLAGGVLKNYQPPITVILEAISGNVVSAEGLPTNATGESEKDTASVIAFSKSEEPWALFETYIAEAVKKPHVLAFYLPAKLGLAHYLAAGLKPDEAAFAWITTTKSVLNFVRKHRKSVFLVNADTALQFPEEFMEICVNKYRFNGTDRLGDLPKKAPVSDLHGIFANQIIIQNRDVLKLQQELEARSEPISPYSTPDVFDLKSVFEELNASTENYENAKAQIKRLGARDAKASRKLEDIKTRFGKLSDANQSLETDNKLLLEQLEAMQAELLEGQEASEVNKALFVEQLDGMRAELASNNQRFEKNKSLLLEQLEAVQAELIESQKNPDGKKLLIENARLKADLSDLQIAHEASLLHAKELAAANAEAIGDAKRSNMKDGLMSEQMASIQSDATETFHNFLKVSTELEELKKVARWKEGKAERVVAELENDLARTHKRIDSLQSSFSWKVTRPVRVLSRAIGLAGRRASQNDVNRVYQSGLFDVDWYLKTYPDLANISMSPIEHFVNYGAFEGRSPGPKFNTRKYTKDNPDVLIDGVNPLLHFLESRNED
jgi:hypothetical protein